MGTLHENQLFPNTHDENVIYRKILDKKISRENLSQFNIYEDMF